MVLSPSKAIQEAKWRMSTKSQDSQGHQLRSLSLHHKETQQRTHNTHSNEGTIPPLFSFVNKESNQNFYAFPKPVSTSVAVSSLSGNTRQNNVKSRIQPLLPTPTFSLPTLDYLFHHFLSKDTLATATASLVAEKLFTCTLPDTSVHAKQTNPWSRVLSKKEKHSLNALRKLDFSGFISKKMNLLKRTGKCFNCFKKGHRSFSCHSLKKCWGCEKPGHSLLQCSIFSSGNCSVISNSHEDLTTLSKEKNNLTIPDTAPLSTPAALDPTINPVNTENTTISSISTNSNSSPTHLPPQNHAQPINSPVFASFTELASFLNITNQSHSQPADSKFVSEPLVGSDSSASDSPMEGAPENWQNIPMQSAEQFQNFRRTKVSIFYPYKPSIGRSNAFLLRSAFINITHGETAMGIEEQITAHLALRFGGTPNDFQLYDLTGEPADWIMVCTSQAKRDQVCASSPIIVGNVQLSFNRWTRTEGMVIEAPIYWARIRLIGHPFHLWNDCDLTTLVSGFGAPLDFDNYFFNGNFQYTRMFIKCGHPVTIPKLIVLSDDPYVTLVRVVIEGFTQIGPVTPGEKFGPGKGFELPLPIQSDDESDPESDSSANSTDTGSGSVVQALTLGNVPVFLNDGTLRLPNCTVTAPDFSNFKLANISFNEMHGKFQPINMPCFSINSSCMPKPPFCVLQDRSLETSSLFFNSINTTQQLFEGNHYSPQPLLLMDSPHSPSSFHTTISDDESPKTPTHHSSDASDSDVPPSFEKPIFKNSNKKRATTGPVRRSARLQKITDGPYLTSIQKAQQLKFNSTPTASSKGPKVKNPTVLSDYKTSSKPISLFHAESILMAGGIQMDDNLKNKLIQEGLVTLDEE